MRTRALAILLALAACDRASPVAPTPPAGSGAAGSSSPAAQPTAGGNTTSPASTTPSAASPAAQPWFVECARERGLVFDYRSGHAGDRYLFPEIAGGGVALFDMDGDGDLDVYFVQAGSLVDPVASRPPNRLFKNRGDGTFEDVSAGSGTEDRGYGMGVAVGDYDNDGDPDLYVTNLGPNVLLRNDGNGRFTDVTEAARVVDPAWSVSAAFFDYDQDGDLDLFVTNYVRWSLGTEISCDTPPLGRDYCGPYSYLAPESSTLYRNEGDGRFTDVSVEAGMRTTFGNGLGVTSGDFDGDGRPDVFVANDGTPNQLWRNAGGGRFQDRAFLAGCGVDENGHAKAGMGVSTADLDDDGDEDLLVVNLNGEGDSLYRNDGRFFSDRTAAAGLAVASRMMTRFGCGIFDFDDDGRLDIYEANGRVLRSLDPPGPDPYAEPNLLFRGVAAWRFEEVLPRGGTAEPLIATSRGAAFGDLDGDGAIDVVVVNRDGPAHLLRNVASPRGKWIGLRVLEEHGRDAYGAVVRARLGERNLMRVVRSSLSYASASDALVHVGLGDAQGLAGVTVRWIDGATESFGDLAAGRIVELRRGRGTPLPPTPAAPR